MAGRQWERNEDHLIQRLDPSLLDTGDLSCPNQYAPHTPQPGDHSSEAATLTTHVQHQGELLAEPAARGSGE